MKNASKINWDFVDVFFSFLSICLVYLDQNPNPPEIADFRNGNKMWPWKSCQQFHSISCQSFFVSTKCTDLKVLKRLFGKADTERKYVIVVKSFQNALSSFWSSKFELFWVKLLGKSLYFTLGWVKLILWEVNLKSENPQVHYFYAMCIRIVNHKGYIFDGLIKNCLFHTTR